MVEVSLVKLPLWGCHWTSLMIGQHWFRQWLGAVRQQAIYLSQCWPSSMSPYVITRPQYVLICILSAHSWQTDNKMFCTISKHPICTTINRPTTKRFVQLVCVLSAINCLMLISYTRNDKWYSSLVTTLCVGSGLGCQYLFIHYDVVMPYGVIEQGQH